MGLLLSTPITEKDSITGSNEKLRFGCSAMQGWRTGMEDAHSCEASLTPTSSFFGVFDGHGGSVVAKYCGKNMPTALMSVPSWETHKYEQALEEAFIKVDHDLKSPEGLKALSDINGSDIHPEGVGCTAVCALIIDGKIYCANSGDSRCVLGRDGKAVEMSHDHKPLNPLELERIQKAGGFVQQGRVNGNLNLSRAIGDHDYKRNTTLPDKDQIITCVPDVIVQDLVEADRFLILACDGVWDVLSNQDAVDFVSKWVAENPTLPLNGACEAVLMRCLASDPSNGIGCDNMTCIVVDLHPPPPSAVTPETAAATTTTTAAAETAPATTPTTTPTTETSSEMTEETHPKTAETTTPTPTAETPKPMDEGSS
ncbi:Protein phosphatase 2C 2 [Pelomyxa schiedti]|nr:Protein phosphatase 2C 2 [Pelomyxa schiedti]